MTRICGKPLIQQLVKGYAVGMSLYHLYHIALGGAEPFCYRFTHVSMVLVLGFVLLALETRRRARITAVCYTLLSLLIYGYFSFHYQRLLLHVPFMDLPTTFDLVIGVMFILLILEAARRYISWVLSGVSLFFLLYALAGSYLPPLLQHRGLSFAYVIDYLAFTTNGIFGSAIAVSSHVLMLFIIFGSFLSISGAGEYFTDLAAAIAGGTRGGPAKVAVIASAFIGSILGGGTSNVTTTGVFTIPLMKKNGFDPNFAAGVEAAASTGGAILPPVMGASAFIMAEILGISYTEVAKASLLPALLYYLAVLIMVDLEAAKQQMTGLSAEDRPAFRKTLLRIYNLLPLGVIVYFLLRGYSTSVAGLSGIAACIAVSILNHRGKLQIRLVVQALEQSSKVVVRIVLACASAGIIIGSVTLTGLTGRFTSLLLYMSGGIELLVLVFVMLSTLILGMGMAVTPAYVLAAVLGGPALISLGFTPVAAHLFILYFAALAPLTPPVAITAYVAAGIAGGEFSKTALKSIMLASAGFLIPYVFIYHNELLLVGTTTSILLSVATAVIGIAFFAAGIQGYLCRKLSAPARILAVIGGCLIVIPGVWSNILGSLLLCILVYTGRINILSGMHSFINHLKRGGTENNENTQANRSSDGSLSDAERLQPGQSGS